MNSAPSDKQKHKRRRTATPTATIIHHHTTTPTATVLHHHATPTTTIAPTSHFTRPSNNFADIPDPTPPPLPVNDSFVWIGEDPMPPPFPVNETMSFASVVPKSVRSGYNVTPFVFALPFIVLGAWIAQTKFRRYGYVPIRTVEISSSEV